MDGVFLGGFLEGLLVILCNIINVEGLYGQLCIRFIDGLCCDDVDSFVCIYDGIVCKVMIVILCIDVFFGFIGQWVMDVCRCNICFVDFICYEFVDQLVFGNDNFVGIWMQNVICSYMVQNMFCKGCYDFVVVDCCFCGDCVFGVIVVYVNDIVLCNVNQMMGQVI